MKGPLRARTTAPPRRRDAARSAPPSGHRRWVALGIAVGTLAALTLYAPAAWLAAGVAQLTGERLLLAQAEGSIWAGNAVVVLAGGPGSQAARALPGRLTWRLRPTGDGLTLSLDHACCLTPGTALSLQPGWGSLRLAVQPAQKGDQLTAVGQWPAAWLIGLGTPWNTLQPGGALRLSTRELQMQWVQGRFRMTGQAQLDLQDFSSRLATLPRLGSYRLAAIGDDQGGATRLQLSTLDGALQLQAEGTLGASGLRLRGEATAAQADQRALNNLLNIIGRRQGARTLISIG